MKASAIYREAAERIAQHNDYACNVIERVKQRRNIQDFDFQRCEESQRYSRMFCPRGRTFASAWLLPSDIPDCDTQTFRVLALCFMAAISESEGD